MSAVIYFFGFVSFALLLHSGVEGKDKKWCDPILGCLELTNDWYSAAKPLNVLPDSREKINTRFILQTKEIPEDVYISADNLASITSSTFNPARPTKLITHGFLDNGNKKWIKNFANSLLVYSDYNIIRIDWGRGALDNYISASANIRVVGLEISHLINTMTELNDLDPKTVHIMAHSLGAHAAGHAGENIRNLGRISGLDPAGPGFTNTDTFIRLDPSDALFVDNIHSDIDTIFLFGLGTKQPMGHLDFYPNGGHEQPGCALIKTVGFWNWANGPRDVIACNHQRAVNFFEESLFGNSCQWLAHECSNYESYQNSLCSSCGEDNSACAYLGIRAYEYTMPERENVVLYLVTGDEPMFCRVHYNLDILTYAHQDAEDMVVGNLRITLYGSNGGVIKSTRITDKHEKIKHGSVIRYIFSTDQEIGTTLHVELEWNYNDTLNPATYCTLWCNRSLYVKSIQVSPASVYPESVRIVDTFLGCTTEEITKMKDGKLISFTQYETCAAIPTV